MLLLFDLDLGSAVYTVFGCSSFTYLVNDTMTAVRVGGHLAARSRLHRRPSSAEAAACRQERAPHAAARHRNRKQ